VRTGKKVDTRKKCHWSHSCKRFKWSKDVKIDGILECKSLSKNVHPYTALAMMWWFGKSTNVTPRTTARFTFFKDKPSGELFMLQQPLCVSIPAAAPASISSRVTTPVAFGFKEHRCWSSPLSMPFVFGWKL
jgi:hypothetical protein